MIEAYALYSGSSGNAYLIKCGGVSVLVDAGRSSAALCRRIREAGEAPENISAVFVSHEHTDHVSALRVFSSKYRMPLIGAAPVLCAVCENESMRTLGRALSPGKRVGIGELFVSACPVPHDCAANYCYRFESENGDSIAIATDMGEVTCECVDFLSGAACAVIEANHDAGMLRNGRYPRSLKSRIASGFGHLSNDQCGELAKTLVDSGTTGIVLAHLSAENNTMELAEGTVRRAIPEFNGALECSAEDVIIKMTVDGGRTELCSIPAPAAGGRL